MLALFSLRLALGMLACLPTLLVLAQRLTGLAWSPETLDEPHLLSYLPARPR